MKTRRRRRKQGKTDYKLRFGLLKTKEPRLVIRKTNRYLTAQIVKTKIAQDSTIISASTKDLLKNGWPLEQKNSLKNLSASYLLGILISKYAQKKKINHAILDIGLNRNTHKSRIYALLKGAVDGGLKIPHKEKILLKEEDFKKNKRSFELINKLKEKLGENGRERNKK